MSERSAVSGCTLNQPKRHLFVSLLSHFLVYRLFVFETHPALSQNCTGRVRRVRVTKLRGIMRAHVNFARFRFIYIVKWP